MAGVGAAAVLMCAVPAGGIWTFDVDQDTGAGSPQAAANLTNANLARARLTQAAIWRADLSHAILEDADLVEAKLHGSLMHTQMAQSN